MRIIKLSDKEPLFQSLRNVVNYFEEDLRERKPQGKFRIYKPNPDSSPKIGVGGLEEGEKVIFSYKGLIVYTGYVKSGVEKNTDKYREKYPLYFIVNVARLNRIFDVKLHDLERLIRTIDPEMPHLVKSHAWPIIKETKKINRAISGLLFDDHSK